MDLPVGIHLTYRNVAPIILLDDPIRYLMIIEMYAKTTYKYSSLHSNFFIIILDLGRNRQTRLRAYIQRTYLGTYYKVYILQRQFF